MAMLSRSLIRKEKGFTLVELMVVLAIFAVVTAAVFSFHQMQSQRGVSAARKKLAEQTIRLAMMTLTKDVLQAGLGLVGREQLAVYVKQGVSTDDPGGPSPYGDLLYLSFSYHVDMDLTGYKPYSFYDGLAGGSSTPGLNKVWFQLTGSSLTLLNFKYAIASHAVGGIIADGVPYGQKLTTLTTSAPDSKGLTTLTLNWTAPPNTGTVAPAILYRLSKAPDTTMTGEMQYYPMGRLLRNGVPLAGADSKELRPLVKITDFQVRCRFKGDAGNESVCNDCPADASFQSKAKDLRLLEITIRYIWRSPEGGYATPGSIPTTTRDAYTLSTDPPGQYTVAGDNTSGPWTSGGVQRFTISPRNIVMGQYLGGN